MIQKELGSFFQRESRSYFSGALITVTSVRTTKDLSIAKVYLSLFATNDKKALLDVITHNKKLIRHNLAVQIKNQVRVVPELEFFIDDSLDYIENIEKLLKK